MSNALLILGRHMTADLNRRDTSASARIQVLRSRAELEAFERLNARQRSISCPYPRLALPSLVPPAAG